MHNMALCIGGCYTLKNNKKRGESIGRPPRSPDLPTCDKFKNAVTSLMLPEIHGELKPQFRHNTGRSPSETYVRTYVNSLCGLRSCQKAFS